MRLRSILLVGLMVLVSFSPVVSAEFEDKPANGPQTVIEQQDAFEIENTGSEKPFEIVRLDEIPIRVGSSGTSGRAPCPAIQNDGGSAGDAGNTSATSKSLGTDPNNAPAGVSGCVDAADAADMYGITTTAGKQVDIELVVPSGADFDLYLTDSTGPVSGTIYDYSEYNDPLESVSTSGTILEGNATTFYIYINAYSGDGTYTLRVWTNQSVNCTNLWGAQDDANTGGDAPDNYTMSPTNMGTNVTSSYSGCLDNDDQFDVFAFDVPASHIIEITLSWADTSNDYDLYLKDNAGNIIDSGAGVTIPEEATSYGSSKEGIAGTYYVNITAYSGKGNYTLDVWTNYSEPIVNLVVGDVSSATSSNPGDTFSANVTVNNTGTLNSTDTFNVELYFSTDRIASDFDHLVGTSSITGLDFGTSKTVSIQGPVPVSIIEGTYRLIAVVDTNEVVNESDDDDNSGLRNSEVTIGTVATSCPNQNDASSSNDAGNELSTAVDLGQPVDIEFRGCMDSNDKQDYYKISVAAGENLNITLVNAPDGDLWGDLVWNSNGSSISESFGLSADDYFTTWDTDLNGTGGDFTLMLNWTDFGFVGLTGGAGDYRLIVGEPAEFVAPFTCVGFSDGGTGTDAGTGLSDPMAIGNNPMLTGQGCLSGQDSVDAYQFALEDSKNVDVMFMPDPGSQFTANLYDENDTMVSGWNGTSWSSMNDMAHEGQDGTFTLVIDSLGAEGYYNLTISTTDPAPADLSVSNLSCGSDMISNDQIFYSFDIHNLRGPTGGNSFTWSLEMIDVNGQTLEEIDSSSESTFANYGQLVLQRASSTFIDYETASGVYACKLMVNMDGSVVELDLSNNEIIGENFTVQNEEELWANDADRDGYNTTDSGDGIVDDCPDKFGESYGDRFGCADLDGDGWSNLNDFSPLDETQWIDEDEDGFGDNSSGFLGDQCPGVYGVENGDGGDGCPPPFVDTDDDQVQDSDDLCENSPAGVTVDENGCEVDSDGDGLADSLDKCPDTEVNATVDSEGCKITDNEGTGDGGDTGDGLDTGDDNQGSDDSKEDDGKDTEDSAESGTDVVMIGGIGGGVIVIILLSLLIMRKGRSDDQMVDDSFAHAAFDQPMVGAVAADPSITPEQLQYEQQLHAAGYNAEQARAYADQHFRPWLNQ